MDPLQSKRSQSTMWGYRTEVSTVCENSLTEKHAAAAHLSKTVPAGAKLRSNVVGKSWNNEVQQNCLCSYWMWELSMEPKYAAPDSIWSRDKPCLETSTCCTSWRENDEHCMQQLAWWPHQKQSWPNAHASIPEFWGSKCPHLRQKFEVNSQLTHSQKLQGSTEPHWPRLILGTAYGDGQNMSKSMIYIDLSIFIVFEGWMKIHKSAFDPQS